VSYRATRSGQLHVERSDQGLLVREVVVERTDADARVGADLVEGHRHRTVRAEARQRGLQQAIACRRERTGS
jgi:hypothetical protein